MIEPLHGQLQTSAMWAPPSLLWFLKDVKTYEHVSTTATLEPGKQGRIVNVGLKGRRGKIVPFYYLHWWQLDALGPGRTQLTDYELLKGSAIKFWLGATAATVEWEVFTPELPPWNSAGPER